MHVDVDSAMPNQERVERYIVVVTPVGCIDPYYHRLISDGLLERQGGRRNSLHAHKTCPSLC